MFAVVRLRICVVLSEETCASVRLAIALELNMARSADATEATVPGRTLPGSALVIACDNFGPVKLSTTLTRLPEVTAAAIAALADWATI